MAENTQTFVLVGQFKDGITPSLRKLNTQIGGLTRSFEKFSRTLRPISKELGVMAMASERLAKSQKDGRNVYEGNIRVLREYKKAIGDVGAAHTALSKRTPKAMNMPRYPNAPRSQGGGGGMPGGGGMGAAAAMVAGERAGDKGVGFWGMTGAMMMANFGVQAATSAFHKLTGSLNGFVMSGSQAEQSVIQMSGTLMTLGKVGSYEKSQKMADQMMGDLGKVAAALPGSTENYLSILQQTLDDQIQSFGSVEAVQKNLAGFDYETGKELAGGAEQSFTALLGMSAQIAGMRPELAAMDLMQLKQNPENIRQVQLLTRNPTLQAFYKEELKKSGGDFIKALDKAMKRAIPKEQIEALKNSFDSSYQSFITLFTDKFGGIFGPMRKVTVMVTKLVDGVEVEVERTMSAMEPLGRIMRSINEIATSLASLFLGGKYDPMVMLINALNELDFFFYVLANDVMYLVDDMKAGTADIGDLAHLFGQAVGEAIAKFTNWVMNLDFEQFFQTIDTLVYNFFKGLFEGFIANYTGIDAGNKGPLGGLGTSVTGTIVTLGGLALAVKALAGVIGTAAAFISGAGAVIAGWAGIVTPVVTVLSGAMSILATAVTTVVLPFLAVAAAVLGTIAILRHGDFILSFFWEGIKLAGNAVMWFIHTLQEAQARLWAGIFNLLSKIPGIGGMFKGMAAQAEKEAAEFQKKKLDREKAMAANAAKIADNTAKSWERTQGDFKMLGDKLKGFGHATQVETLSMAELSKQTTDLAESAKKASSTFDNNMKFEEGGKKFGWAMKNGEKVIVEWGSVAGTALKGVADAADAANTQLNKVTKPAGTPTMDNRNYTQGGVTYDWRTGLPVKPGTPSTPESEPKPRGQGNRPRPNTPTPAAAPTPQAVTATVPPQSFAPVTTAVQTGTTATNAVNTSTQGVQTAVNSSTQGVQTAINTAQVEATKQATQQYKMLNNLVIGINNVKSALMTISNKVATQATLQQVAQNTAKTNELLASGKLKVSFSLSGVGGKGGPGMVDAFNPVAQSFGLQVTSGYRPGDDGYHGVNRARDYSNSTGPTPQMMDFAKFMAANFGGDLAELIYTPLGFSIKNGQVTPPYAQAGHYNHVHVAFGRGPGNPTMFTNARAAMAYESMMAPAGARVASVTANSSEFGGGEMSLTQNITVNGAVDPKATAEAVWSYTQQQVEKLRYSNFG